MQWNQKAKKSKIDDNISTEYSYKNKLDIKIG